MTFIAREDGFLAEQHRQLSWSFQRRDLPQGPSIYQWKEMPLPGAVGQSLVFKDTAQLRPHLN